MDLKTTSVIAIFLFLLPVARSEQNGTNVTKATVAPKCDSSCLSAARSSCSTSVNSIHNILQGLINRAYTYCQVPGNIVSACGLVDSHDLSVIGLLDQLNVCDGVNPNCTPSLVASVSAQITSWCSTVGPWTQQMGYIVGATCGCKGAMCTDLVSVSNYATLLAQSATVIPRCCAF